MRRDRFVVSMVSSYPPSACGVGRFAWSLTRALEDAGSDVNVMRAICASDRPAFQRNVVMEFDPNGLNGLSPIVRRLDQSDAVIVQHEFGLYGPNDGERIVEVVGGVSAPVISVLHTVLKSPSARQLAIVQALWHESHLVVPSHAARAILDEVYAIPAETVTIIAHGTHWGPIPINPAPRRSVLSWGLLGPGKGLERTIRAMPIVAEMVPDVGYTIAGRTHPNVYREHGSAYRASLRRLASDLGVDDRVVFDDRYLSEDDLHAAVGAADIVTTPYDNDAQISSGVLVEAVSMGRPVVATRFPHAVELLTGGAGSLVDHDDDRQLANAIVELLTDERRYTAAVAECERRGAEMSWTQVASRYRSLIERTHNLESSAV